MILAHSIVGAESAPHFGLFLHGVLGAGHNLRSLAKRLCERRPEWRFALVDLRCHGKSLGASPPHTLEACADDLVDLARHLGHSPRAVIGHSLGGKVALAYGLRHEQAGDQILPPDPGALHQIWTLDSDPGAQVPGENHQVRRVLGALLQHRGPFSSRDAAVSALEASGLSLGLRNWLATSLDRTPRGLEWRFELDNISKLLDDYFTVDYWAALRALAHRPLTPSRPSRFDLLVAENSDRWSGSMREQAEILHGGPRLHVHHLPNAGHWVHVDNPGGLLQILADHLVA